MILDIIDDGIKNHIEKTFVNYCILTDDGHGWLTPGKRSFTNPVFYENEFNSLCEAKLLMLLELCGIKKFQLSPGTIDTELGKRKLVENEVSSNMSDLNVNTLGISIHCDAFGEEQNKANGFCVYYYSSAGMQLARCIADSVIESDLHYNHVVTPRHNNGIDFANFYVLRETLGTWVLIENAFMTNDGDLRKLKDDSFKNHRALAILNGFYNYILKQ